MISKSHGQVSVISLDSFHLSYLARTRVNGLDESIALGFDEGNILFAFSGSSIRDGRKLSPVQACIEYTSACASVYVAMLLLPLYFKHKTPHQKYWWHTLLELPHVPKSRANLNATNVVVILLFMALEWHYTNHD